MKSILIVDDSKTNLISARSAIGDLYRVIAVPSGAQALRFFENHSCDLILLDINMPEMDGFEVLRMIRSTDAIRRIPVIFLTADSDPETENKCLEAGAVDYITKPFAAKVLRSRVARVLELEDYRNHLQRLVDEKTESFEKLSSNIIKALAHTIDAKDRYTRGHSQRVAEYSLEIAKHMGKSQKEQEIIYYMGLLHDVGKIRVPEDIINKPSRLTDEEFDMIKLHPITGYHILKEISVDRVFSDGARFHHERYDGNGYPNGLSGEQIPEIARIVGVADAYDAMTSNRSYRRALPQDAVRAEIEKGKGTQFDPAIADIMLNIINGDREYKLREKSVNNNNKRILAVDDEPTNIKLISFMLKNVDNYTVDGAKSGAKALEMLENEHFDLVLLDVKMPEMDGFETAEKIREFSNIPIVFLTADKLSLEMDKMRKYNIADFITRPFNPAILMEILHAVLAE